MKIILKDADFSNVSIGKVPKLIYSNGDNIEAEFIADETNPLSGTLNLNDSVQGSVRYEKASNNTPNTCIYVAYNCEKLVGKKIKYSSLSSYGRALFMAFSESNCIKEISSFANGETIFNSETIKLISIGKIATANLKLEEEITIPEGTKMLIVWGYKYNSASEIKENISLKAAEDIYL